jgi:hypothetical protein
MKKGFKFSWLWLLGVIFPKKSSKLILDSAKELPVTYTDVSEEVLSDNCVGNAKERIYSVGIEDLESDAAVEYLSREKVIYADIEFEKKVLIDLNKKEKKRRNLIYKLHTTAGVVIFEGSGLKSFLLGTKLILPFNYKAAYRFANKYGKDKVFKEKYLISFEEVMLQKEKQIN